jgi:methylmalonyl-CoA/ethylmalonyl-CoA epimerase
LKKHNLKLHHSGFIVKEIDVWEKQMLFEMKVKDVIDPLQNARLALYKNFSDTYIELIQPLNQSAYTWNSLNKNGNHFHHFCYEIDNINMLNTLVAENKLILILEPMPAILFDNRYVCFYYTRNKQVVEFLIVNYES